MATLPVSETNVNILDAMQFADYENLTWHKDSKTKQIIGLVDDFEAVKQAIEVLFQVERYAYVIYSPNFGMEWNGLVGKDYGYVVSEIERRIKDAIVPDNRLVNISGFKHKKINSDSIEVEFVVNTVYGAVSQNLSVSITA